MLQQKFIVQVTTIPDCDDITRFDGNLLIPSLPIGRPSYTRSLQPSKENIQHFKT
jgi:hypothetical protein